MGAQKKKYEKPTVYDFLMDIAGGGTCTGGDRATDGCTVGNKVGQSGAEKCTAGDRAGSTCVGGNSVGS